MAGSLNAKITGELRIKAPTVTPRDLVAIGGAAIHSLRERVAANRNVKDAPAKPYSPRGPIYVPISGRGQLKRGGQLVKRNKSTLGGREILTSADLRKLKLKGAIILKRGQKGGPAKGLVLRDTGKSIKFRDYAEYKRALGKSGLRDLELSGRMLNAIAIVRVDAFVVSGGGVGGGSVTIGFTRELEHLKAQGNQRRDEWWPLSPTDVVNVTKVAKQLLPKIAGRMIA